MGSVSQDVSRRVPILKHHKRNFVGFPDKLKKVTKPDTEHPLLLGITGKLGSGKSTARNYILETYGGVNIGFADALKLEVYDYLTKRVGHLPAIQDGSPLYVEASKALDGEGPKLVLPTDAEKIKWINDHKSFLRPLLQWWGTEYRRRQNPNYWIDQTLSKIETEIGRGVVVITVDDLRFHNEAMALQNIGFEIIRLICDNHTRVHRAKQRDKTLTDEAFSHSSETEQDTIAVYAAIENSREEHHTHKQIDKVIQSILNR